MKKFVNKLVTSVCAWMLVKALDQPYVCEQLVEMLGENMAEAVMNCRSFDRHIEHEIDGFVQEAIDSFERGLELDAESIRGLDRAVEEVLNETKLEADNIEDLDREIANRVEEQFDDEIEARIEMFLKDKGNREKLSLPPVLEKLPYSRELDGLPAMIQDSELHIIGEGHEATMV